MLGFVLGNEDIKIKDFILIFREVSMEYEVDKEVENYEVMWWVLVLGESNVWVWWDFLGKLRIDRKVFGGRDVWVKFLKVVRSLLGRKRKV